MIFIIFGIYATTSDFSLSNSSVTSVISSYSSTASADTKPRAARSFSWSKKLWWRIAMSARYADSRVIFWIFDAASRRFFLSSSFLSNLY